MRGIEIIGFMAGTFTAVSLIPQTVKSWTRKSTKDISLLWTIGSLVSQILWIIYGVVEGSISIIVTSSMIAFMSFLLFVLKLKFG